MPVRFIVGRAGTGKTAHCMDGFHRELESRPQGPMLIFLVPDQATFQVEHDLLGSGPEAMIRGQVLSFRRLAYRVLQETGAFRPFINEVGKKILLASILQNRASELAVFDRSAQNPGFVETAASLLSELHAYDIDGQTLERCAQQIECQEGGVGLSRKIKDVCLVYADLVRRLEDRYSDPDDCLTLLSQSVSGYGPLHGARVWVDGFAGFTPQEYDVLGELMRVTSRMEIALCLDSSQLNVPPLDTDLFSRSRETYDYLARIASQKGVELEPPLMLDSQADVPQRFTDCSALAHLERQLYNPRPEIFRGRPEGIEIIAAADRRAEVEAVACRITALVRDRGLRWRDCSVILRSLEPYEDTISSVFTDYGIPFFMDRNKEPGCHPVTELISSALETVVSDWSNEAVLRFLKTDLVSFRPGAVDRLENYVLARGIRGKKAWFETTQQPGETAGEREALGEIERLVLLPLEDFQKDLRRAENAGGMVLALFELLDRLQVAKILEAWRREAADKGDLREAQEHAQVWKEILELMDQIVENIGGEVLEVRDFASMLDIGIRSMRLKLVPPSLDQVLVASVERSRHPLVKASFVLGANEGVFPSGTSENAMLSDRDRDSLAAVGLGLGPDSGKRLLQEQFLIYIAVTRPSQSLYISYALAEEQGRALVPSGFVQRLQVIFPELAIERSETDPSTGDAGPELFCSPNAAARMLLKQMRDSRSPLDSPWKEALYWFRSNPERWLRFSGPFSSIGFVNREDPLAEGVVARLFGRCHLSSVSALEQYAACPFAHFLNRGLRLKQREEFRLLPSHSGTLFHEALKRFVERLGKEDTDWGELAAGDARLMIREIWEELVPQVHHRIMLSSPTRAHESRMMLETLERTVEILSLHARRGSFRPAAVEIPFGFEGGPPALEIDLGRGRTLVVRGRIDRVDVAEHEGRLYARILDYKSRKSQLKLSEVCSGLALQLCTYLAYVVEHGEELFGSPALPAGMLYFAVTNPVVNSEEPLDAETADREFKKRMKTTGVVLADPEIIRMMDGDSTRHSDLIPVEFTNEGLGAKSKVLSPEQFALLLKFTRLKLSQLACGISEGDVSLTPFREGGQSACSETYCEFRPVCGFDPLGAGNAFRRLFNGDDGAAIARMKQELGEANG